VLVTRSVIHEIPLAAVNNPPHATGVITL